MLKTMLIIVFLAALFAAPDANADKVSIDIQASDLSTYKAQDKTDGDYYVLHFDVPQNVAQVGVDAAILEFFVDASAKAKAGYTNDTPIIEVYALKSAFSGQVDATQLESPTRPTRRNVVVGQGRRVMIDITDIVKSYIETPQKNHGLIIGSLTGHRDGLFNVKADKYEGNALGRITFYLSTVD